MKIIFICLGNICRSPMAEYLFKDMLDKRGIKGVEVLSRGTSDEEEGNPIHYGTRKVLNNLGIDCSRHRARKITKKECEEADLLIVMEDSNVWWLELICGSGYRSKIKKLLDFTPRGGAIADPWYTHDFETCYRDVNEGLLGLLEYIS